MASGQNNKEEVIESAAAEIVQFVAELVRPWVEFHGHEGNIAAIIKKHLDQQQGKDA